VSVSKPHNNSYYYNAGSDGQGSARSGAGISGGGPGGPGPADGWRVAVRQWRPVRMLAAVPRLLCHRPSTVASRYAPSRCSAIRHAADWNASHCILRCAAPLHDGSSSCTDALRRTGGYGTRLTYMCMVAIDLAVVNRARPGSVNDSLPPRGCARDEHNFGQLVQRCVEERRARGLEDCSRAGRGSSQCSEKFQRVPLLEHGWTGSRAVDGHGDFRLGSFHTETSPMCICICIQTLLV